MREETETMSVTMDQPTLITEPGERQPSTTPIRSAARLGFWAAMLTGVLSIAWSVALLYQTAVAPLPAWHGGVALLFAAPVFAGQGLERRIRRLFVVMGLVGAAQLAVGVFDLPGSLSVIYGPAWIVGIPLVAALLAVVFRRAELQ
jgi:hypothetical protein